jgi:hypothetical protein
VGVVRWLLGRIVVAAMSGLVVVDGTFGRRDPMISRTAAKVGYAWLMRELWRRLDVVLLIWGGLWNE